jgi:hypothetical protein
MDADLVDLRIDECETWRIVTTYHSIRIRRSGYECWSVQVREGLGESVVLEVWPLKPALLFPCSVPCTEESSSHLSDHGGHGLVGSRRGLSLTRMFLKDALKRKATRP